MRGTKEVATKTEVKTKRVSLTSEQVSLATNLTFTKAEKERARERGREKNLGRKRKGIAYSIVNEKNVFCR